MRTTDTVKVPSHSVVFVMPGPGKRWRVTALVAKGPSFGIKFCCPARNELTDEILTNDYDLFVEVAIDDTTYLQFSNRSSNYRVGFYSGEELL